jgi:hypothetical protein
MAVPVTILADWTDPVYQTEEGWWHYDESWSHAYGPWPCEAQARKGLNMYGAWLNSPEHPN